MISRFALLFALSAFLFTACNKYPDGPAFSLLSKKERVVGEWDLDETVHSDGSVTYNNDSYTLQLTNDNKAISHLGNVSLNGTWDFTSNKEKLRFTYGNASPTYRIMRLKSKELWLKDENNGDIDKYSNVE